MKKITLTAAALAAFLMVGWEFQQINQSESALQLQRETTNFARDRDD